ncbi:hypothetical protein [Natronomonas sp.]|uniref:hypothetical protein n=1 Tax=Natronomonas sp. TaxID=2184060 RepID=UPI002FC30560
MKKLAVGGDIRQLAVFEFGPHLVDAAPRETDGLLEVDAFELVDVLALSGEGEDLLDEFLHAFEGLLGGFQHFRGGAPDLKERTE